MYSHTSLIGWVLTCAALYSPARGAVPLDDLCADVGDYRASLGLARLPVSPTMAALAAAHADNLEQYFAFGSECNMHSWFDDGSSPAWVPCCYTSTGPYNCMLTKGTELTGGTYSGASFENAFYSRPAQPSRALDTWKASPGHDALLRSDRVQGCGAAGAGGFVLLWLGSSLEAGAPAPSPLPTLAPTPLPTLAPAPLPTLVPTSEPTRLPTSAPTPTVAATTTAAPTVFTTAAATTTTTTTTAATSTIATSATTTAAATSTIATTTAATATELVNMTAATPSPTTGQKATRAAYAIFAIIGCVVCTCGIGVAWVAAGPRPNPNESVFSPRSLSRMELPPVDTGTEMRPRKMRAAGASSRSAQRPAARARWRADARRATALPVS